MASAWMARRRNRDGWIIAVLLLVGAVDGSARRLATQGQELTQQADRAQPLADAALDRLHLREHEDAGAVQQGLGHVERKRQRPGCQIAYPREDGGGSGKLGTCHFRGCPSSARRTG